MGEGTLGRQFLAALNPLCVVPTVMKAGRGHGRLHSSSHFYRWCLMNAQYVSRKSPILLRRVSWPLVLWAAGPSTVHAHLAESVPFLPLFLTLYTLHVLCGVRRACCVVRSQHMFVTPFCVFFVSLVGMFPFLNLSLRYTIVSHQDMEKRQVPLFLDQLSRAARVCRRASHLCACVE